MLSYCWDNIGENLIKSYEEFNRVLSIKKDEGKQNILNIKYYFL